MHPDINTQFTNGEISHQQLLDAQRAAYPRCAAHDTPTAMVVGSVPLCPRCIEERREGLALWLTSFRLVRGGYEL